MVNHRKQHTRRKPAKQGVREVIPEPNKINASTPYDFRGKNLTPYGGLLPVATMLEKLGFQSLLEETVTVNRVTKCMGMYQFFLGIVLGIYVGFSRLNQLRFIAQDPLLTGILKASRLPPQSTLWRFLAAMHLNVAVQILSVQQQMRERVWAAAHVCLTVATLDTDTTVHTLYGKQMGGRKSYNPKNKGKKSYQPILTFLAETREYLCGTQRRGETITTREVARQIRQFRKLLPPHVQEVRVHGDGEFIGWESVNACRDEGFSFTFGNKRCAPPFPDDGWYRHETHEYNACLYQPAGWEAPCQFVAMRIRQDQRGDRQLKLLDGENYVYRVFVTNVPGRPHTVIEEYDQRADVENLIGEAQREGVLAIPSKRFQTHHAFFQLVMLAYNLWRWMKLLAGHAERQAQQGQPVPDPQRIRLPDHTLRIARLKLLYVAAKICFHDNRDAVLYSIHEQRAVGLTDFLGYLDRRRKAA